MEGELTDKKKVIIVIAPALILMMIMLPLSALHDNMAGDDVNGCISAGKVGGDADAFFNDSYMHEIRLYFDDPNWYNTLSNSHTNNPEKPYFPARFVYEDFVLDPVGVRMKGFSSFRMRGEKKPFTIDFNEYQEDSVDCEETTFFGLKKLNLNVGFKDPTMLREKLFLDFASQYVPTIRCTFTRLYINDEYYGLYSAVEHIDKTFIQSQFRSDEDGNLYRGERSASLTYLGSNPQQYYGIYELKTNEMQNNWSDLIEFTDILNNVPTPNLPEQLEPIFDVKSGLYALALLNLFTSLDSYIGSAHNYYIYDRDDTGQFTYLLWDANEAFGTFLMGMSGADDPLKLDPFWLPSSPGGPGGLPAGPGGQPAGPGGMGSLNQERPLMENLWAVDSYNRTYLRALAQMLREGFNVEAMNAQIQELADLIRDDVYADNKKLYSDSEFEIGLTDDIASGGSRFFGLMHFVEVKSIYLDERLDAFAEKTDLQFNELMTVNFGMVMDAEGDCDPWVEIYNLGPGLVQTQGLFLTDDQSEPNKWELPSQDLDDGQFLLLWLDGETGEGDNHASFSLESDGGELYFYMYEGSSYLLIDNITYPALGANVSYGRFPDGEGSWQEMNDHPTLATPNQVDDITITIPTDLFINEFMADNGFTIASSNGNYPDWIELFNAGDELINLSGMYLTDDLADSTKWRFPNGTFIEPGDHLLVWSDGDPAQGPLHTSFKLRANGEELGLFACDGETLIDSIVFNKQIQDVSYGRIPDGSSNWDYLSISTPSGANEEKSPETEFTVWSIVLTILVSVVSGAVVIGSKIGARR